MDETLQAITTVGFPIVCCMGFAMYIFKERQAEREESRKREERLFNQLNSNNITMDKFNETLISLDKRLENIENKVDCKK